MDVFLPERSYHWKPSCAMLMMNKHGFCTWKAMFFPSVCVILSIIQFLVYVNARNQATNPACKLVSCLAWQALCCRWSSKTSVASCHNWARLQKLIFKHQQFRCEVSRGELYLISCVSPSQTHQWWYQVFWEHMINSLDKIFPIEC